MTQRGTSLANLLNDEDDSFLMQFELEEEVKNACHNNPNESILNTSLDSVISIRGLMSLTSKQQFSSTDTPPQSPEVFKRPAPLTQIFDQSFSQIKPTEPDCKKVRLNNSEEDDKLSEFDVSFMAELDEALFSENVEKDFEKFENSLNSFVDFDLEDISKAQNETIHRNLLHTLIENGERPVRSHLWDKVSKGPFYGLPAKVQELFENVKGIKKLYDWQNECLSLSAVKERKNLIYALPTSGGKTLVAEILLFQEVVCRRRNVLFVMPYVSLVQEKIWGLAPFQVALNFFTEEYANNKGTYPPRKRRSKQTVYVATIEKAANLVNSLHEMNRLDEIGLVIVDEIHLLGEKGRGCVLESLLTSVMYLNPATQIIGMSATIGNLQEIGQFLDAYVYTRDFRPVSLTEYIKLDAALYQVGQDDCFEKVRVVDQMNNKMDPDNLAVLVGEIAEKSSCLIFCPTKKNCENVAILLSQLLDKKLMDNYREERKRLLEIMEGDGGLCSVLKRTIPFGVTYHHSGLTQEERVLVEDSFRSGVINVICCTSTLAAGVNLPAQRVILRSPYVGQHFITLSKYKQMIGRAGRAGYSESGESILICSKNDISKVQSLLLSTMDEANSSMHENEGIKTFVLSAIGLKIATNRKDVIKFLSKTLLAVQKRKLDVKIDELVDGALNDLVKMEIIVLSKETYSVTGQGQAAIKSGISVKQAKLLYQDLRVAQQSLVLLNAIHLLYLATPYEVAEQIRPDVYIYYDEFNRLGSDELVAARVIGVNELCMQRLITGQPLKTPSQTIFKRFYVTLMLYQLWNEKNVYEVSENFKVNRGLIQQLMTSAASFAVNIRHFCDSFEEFKCFVPLMDDLGSRLAHCCTPELLPLMELPSVKKARAKLLFKAGYSSLQKIAVCDPYRLVQDVKNLNTRTAMQIINTAKLILLKTVDNLKEDAQELLNMKVEVPVS